MYEISNEWMNKKNWLEEEMEESKGDNWNCKKGSDILESV